ncbi:Ufd1 [Kluyveromyces lactis]|nr:Ufd1 [Kluyveromyces lactis]
MFSGFSSYGNAYANIPQRLEEFFRCYPIAMMNDNIRKDDANYGGKIFLPPSALNKLTLLNIRYPMLFELKSQESGKVTHGGVLEFIAEEGRVYLPQWMMETLQIQPGSVLQICSTDVPLGQFVKLEPQSVDFLDISDPKAVLERVLRNFSTLTIDDIIEISYNNKVYRIRILEVKPESSSKSICVIETDLVTDFAPPVGYVEPDYKSQKKQTPSFDPSIKGLGSMSKRINYAEILDPTGKDKSFLGEGQKLSGKAIKPKEDDIKEISVSLDGEPAPLNLPEGQLFFGFPYVPPKSDDAEDNEIASSKVFQGEGKSLRQSAKRKDKGSHQGSKTKAPKSPEVIEID